MCKVVKKVVVCTVVFLKVEQRGVIYPHHTSPTQRNITNYYDQSTVVITPVSPGSCVVMCVFVVVKIKVCFANCDSVVLLITFIDFYYRIYILYVCSVHNCVYFLIMCCFERLMTTPGEQSIFALTVCVV